jgi:hypothetical protein
MATAPAAPALRWATPEEVEEVLNGDGIEGAAWIAHATEPDAFDLAVPL